MKSNCVCRRSASLFLLSFLPFVIAPFQFVIAGLDPAIHAEAVLRSVFPEAFSARHFSMDRSINSGGDEIRDVVPQLGCSRAS